MVKIKKLMETGILIKMSIAHFTQPHIFIMFQEGAQKMTKTHSEKISYISKNGTL